MAHRGMLIGAALAAMELAGCTAEAEVVEEDASVRYVALGDSYTIGTAVDEAERWPNQLVERVANLELVANLGVNGFTSGDLIANELPALDRHEPELRHPPHRCQRRRPGRAAGAIRGERAAHRRDAARAPTSGPDRVRGDAGLHEDPAGRRLRRPGAAGAAIERINTTLRAVCEDYGIAFVAEPHAISLEAADDPELVADDGLHPSGEQYRRWTDAIAPVVEDLLRD